MLIGFPPLYPHLLGVCQLLLCEDNDAVLKNLKKGRSPRMQHVGRTHRINLDFLFDSLKDPSIRARYVDTKSQVADILTKGHFTTIQWNNLLKLLQARKRKPTEVPQ